MNPLIKAHGLIQDPRIAQAKRLIIEAVADHQKQLHHQEVANQDLKQSYATLISSFADFRGYNLYFPYIGSGFGHGPLVELMDGSIKYDMICGIGPHYFGHCHHDFIQTSIDAAISNTIQQGHLQQNIDTHDLCELLVKVSGLEHCFLSSSGAIANENALKIAFQKNAPANRVLAFDHCFAGRTLALSQITDKPNYREGLPTSLFVDYVPFYNYKEPEESIYKAIKTIKTHLYRYPKQHAAMYFELIQGEGGIYPGSHSFFVSLMQILKENGILVIVDEVQSFGRTPQLFAFQHYGLQNYIDIATIGKMAQVSATLYKKELKPRPGLLSQTFTSSTSAIKAAIYTINTLLQEAYLGPSGKIEKTFSAFLKHFKRLEEKYPELISGPYGIGAMLAFTPFNGDAKRTAKFAQDLFDAGVITFIAGTDPTRIRFLPPVGAITSEQVDHVFDIVESVLTDSKEKYYVDRPPY